MANAVSLEENQDNKNQAAYELAAQYIQNNTPAGAANLETKPPCSSVSDITTDNKSVSIETSSDHMSGKFDTISTTDLKSESAPVDQRYDNKIDKSMNYDNKVGDKSMKQDTDGDGLVDELDKKTETRAETAARIARERQDASAIRRNKSFSIQNSIQKRTSILETSSINNQIGNLMNSKTNKVGEIDFFNNKDDEKNNKYGLISLSMDTN